VAVTGVVLSEAKSVAVPRGYMVLGGLLVDRGLIMVDQLEVVVND